MIHYNVECQIGDKTFKGAVFANDDEDAKQKAHELFDWPIEKIIVQNVSETL